MKLKYCISLLFVGLAVMLAAQAPAGYYDKAAKQKDAALKTALHLIINPHIQVEYYSSASHFLHTDWHPGGYFWDMYSAEINRSWNGGRLNREHNMPKSWFGISGGEENSEPIGSDMHNLFPSEAGANGRKSNYPPGTTSSNRQGNDLGKIGKSTFAGYSGTVYEPADEYKGDFARNYMYMVTCYENYASTWTSTGTQSMLHNETYPVFNNYAVNLLMKWHRADSVSEKETVRNNEIYKIQNNRNPFVDFPELAEHIWGNLKGKAWRNDDFYISYDKKTKTLRALSDEATEYITGTRILNEGFDRQSQVSFIIYSIQGIKVFESKLYTNSTADLSFLMRGMYVAVVYGDSIRGASKFIVE